MQPVDDFHVAQLYMLLKATQKVSENTGEGIVWVKNEPFDNIDGKMAKTEITGTMPPVGKGQYTVKEYHVRSRLPAFVRAFLPTNAMILIEESWNTYPNIRTVLVSKYLAIDRFKIDIQVR